MAATASQRRRRARVPRCALLLLALAAAATPAAAATATPPFVDLPPGVAEVPGVDQASTTPTNYGACSAIEPKAMATSKWCGGATTPAFRAWPDAPGAAARRGAKFGRLTTFQGPVSHGYVMYCRSGMCCDQLTLLEFKVGAAHAQRASCLLVCV